MSKDFDMTPTSGVMQNHVHRLPLRIYFEDTDITGVVYHANYVRYFERGRTDFLRVMGFDYRTFTEGGHVFAIRSLNIDYLLPAEIDNALVVETRVHEVRAAVLDMRQRLVRGTTVLAEATLKVVTLDANMRPRRMPKDMAAYCKAELITDWPEIEVG